MLRPATARALAESPSVKMRVQSWQEVENEGTGRRDGCVYLGVATTSVICIIQLGDTVDAQLFLAIRLFQLCQTLSVQRTIHCLHDGAGSDYSSEVNI